MHLPIHCHLPISLAQAKDWSQHLLPRAARCERKGLLLREGGAGWEQDAERGRVRGCRRPLRCPDRARLHDDEQSAPAERLRRYGIEWPVVLGHPDHGEEAGGLHCDPLATIEATSRALSLPLLAL